MKWERVTIVSRLVSLFFGLCGVFIAWVLYSEVDDISGKVSVYYLVMGGLGFLIFLFVGIVGRIPDFRALARGEKS